MVSAPALLTIMSIWALCAMGTELPFPASEDVDWEDFQSAIAEEDCFGSDCGDASGALSMIQRRVVKTRLGDHVNDVIPEEPAEELELSADEFNAAMMSEDIGEEATSFIQTDAHYERSSIASGHATMTAAVQVDGSLDMNPQNVAMPGEGVASFSVDGHGDFHREEALSLIQTQAHIEKKATSLSHSTASAAVNADGTLNMDAQEAATPSDGMMHISVDAHGDFRGDEALSLMQTEARIEQKSTAVLPEIPDEAFADDDVYDFGMPGEEGVVSLLQTDFHIERVGASLEESAAGGAVNADGTLEMNPQRATIPGDGIMHLSVDAHGTSHLEI